MHFFDALYTQRGRTGPQKEIEMKERKREEMLKVTEGIIDYINQGGDLDFYETHEDVQLYASNGLDIHLTDAQAEYVLQVVIGWFTIERDKEGQNQYYMNVTRKFELLTDEELRAVFEDRAEQLYTDVYNDTMEELVDEFNRDEDGESGTPWATVGLEDAKNNIFFDTVIWKAKDDATRDASEVRRLLRAEAEIKAENEQ